MNTQMKDMTIALYVGQYLNQTDVEFVSPQEVQDWIYADSSGAGGYRVELGHIRSVMDSLSLGEFLDKIVTTGENSVYTWHHKTVVHEHITKNVVPFATVGIEVDD